LASKSTSQFSEWGTELILNAAKDFIVPKPQVDSFSNGLKDNEWCSSPILR
jgi:hypothetical protein